MNADKILPILCRYLKDTDNRLLANLTSFQSDFNLSLKLTSASISISTQPQP